MVAPYKADTVNHAINNATAKNMVAPYQAGMVKHATMYKMAKITDSIFIGHMRTINNTDKDRLRVMRLAKKISCKIHD